MFRRVLYTIFGSALLAGLASCGDSAGPSISRGTYYLTALDDLPAPFVLSDDHFSTGERIVSERVVDSISVQSRVDLYRARAESTTFYAPDGSSTGGAGYWGSSGTYHVSNGRMIIEFVNYIGDPTPPETLQVLSDSVLLGRELVGGWCLSGPPQECPTAPRIREFRYARH